MDRASVGQVFAAFSLLAVQVIAVLGHDYIFGFTENLVTKNPVGIIYMSYAGNGHAAVRVLTPMITASHKIDQTLCLSSNSTHKVTVTYDVMMHNTSLEGKGIHIWSSKPITVQCINSAVGLADGFEVPEVGRLGTQYLGVTHTKPFPPGNAFNGPYVVGVVGTEDGTSVEVYLGGVGTLSVTYGGAIYTNGDTISFSLDRYQTIQLGALSDIGMYDGDITGTSVSASRPVYTQSGSVATPVHGSSAGSLKTTLPPLTQLGHEYIVIPIATRTTGEKVRVVASVDGTTVVIHSHTGDLVANETLARYQMYDMASDSSTYYHLAANKPVMVAHITKSNDVDRTLYNTDPQLTVLPSIESWSNDYLFTTMADYANVDFDNYVNIAIETAHISGLRLNGSSIPGAWQVLSGTNWSATQISVFPGTSRLYHIDEKVFGGILYGVKVEESYAMILTAVVEPSALYRQDTSPGGGGRLIVEHRSSELADLEHTNVRFVGVTSRVECAAVCVQDPCLCNYIQYDVVKRLCHVIKAGPIIDTVTKKGTNIYRVILGD